MRKKFFWAIGILFVLFIGTLWGIEITDKQKLQKVSAEARVTQTLYEQVDQTVTIMKSYEEEVIPKEVKELGVHSLNTTRDLYMRTIISLDPNYDDRKYRTLSNWIGKVKFLISKEKITDEDLETLDAYRVKIKKFMEQKNETLNQLEYKVNHYWWDS
ncbi:hypothetical protein [Pontibacillus marinus]|uniref:Uncharacterized protein n=1 Tax=Pontibacillus marinus BH030004 = DSM 16465 TaxID=1385511 RepID=A0A0A5G3I8_9BACI|nr:hypothetical protein [Pontibacillus marinus]KGX85645.1 hypothetical protein N783_14215 [Pontibacillus marinus BH030004 = DSM 16465]